MEIKMTITAPAHVPIRPSRRGLLIGCALAALGGMAGPANGQAFNATPTTQFGTVAYDRATPNVETVRIDSATAVIDWRPTDPLIFLPAGNVATFTNGINNADFVVLNRIQATTPMRFDGTVLSILTNAAGKQTGGTVIFSSPGGLIVGGGAVFDVGSLVLTTLNVKVDAGGNFYDPATRGITLDAGISPLASAAVVTEAGAQLRALQPNSYIALIGEMVQHGGSTRVNGSAAYVAGEQVQFRANQGLFDIIVDVGSDNAIPLIHTGSTGGPASTGAGDNHAIYMVAMPKNQAITAVLQGDIGFDPAVVAGVENGVIVLSAGANVVGGSVDRYGHATGTPAADQAANFEINGGIVRSDLIGVARTNIRARPIGAPTLTFQQDVSLYGGSLAAMSVTTGQTIDVLGNVLVSAAAFDTSNPAVFDLTGGQARIFTQDGGAIHISGTATVDASARGLANAGNAGSGTGGSADVTASGGTITIDGALGVLATGDGGVSAIVPLNNGGAGSGGTATLAAAAGGTVNAHAVTMNANGTASPSAGATINGAAGTGGIVNVLGSGAGSVVIAGAFVASASGAGGDLPGGAGLSGGTGTGGTINVQATGGDIDFNASASFVAAGGGGAGPLGGNGLGGTLNVEATGGTIDFIGQVNGGAGGFGGNASVLGGPGGDGRGGTILISARGGDTPSRISGGAISLNAPGQGGRGANGALGTPAGDGGDGTGGSIAILAESANGTLVLGALKLAADGRGGDGGNADNDVDGGTGGAGTGGDVLAGTAAGPAPGGAAAPTGSATFATADLSARGTGGYGGLGAGAGGAGTGGTAGITATGAVTTITGPTTLVADGQGSPGGGSPGGAIGATGLATGGTVNINAAAHPGTGAPGTLALAAVTGSADAQGDGPGNVAGSWHVGASGGSTIAATDMTLTAAADGPGIGVPPASTLDPQDGTITISGTAQLGTDGDILINAAGAGRIAGGAYVLNADRDVILTHATPAAGAFTVDVASFAVQAARDLTVSAGVMTRTAGLTDLGAGRLTRITGRVLGHDIRVTTADLDVTAGGAVGDAATATVDAQVSGNAAVDGQILGQDILVNAATIGVGATGQVGSAVTNQTEVRATGAMTVAGTILGRDVRMSAASLGVGGTGTIGDATSQTVAIQVANNAAVGGRVLGQDILLSAGTIGVGNSGQVGDAASSRTELRATGAATVDGAVLGGNVVVTAASFGVGGTGTIGDATTQAVDIQVTGNAGVDGRILGQDILLSGATIVVGATGQVGGAASNRTELRAIGAASVDGTVLGGNVVVTAASLGVGGSGAIGDAATQSVDLQLTGAANVAGQVLGRNILINGATIDVAASGSIGGATTDLADLNATGTIGVGGAVRGSAIRLASADIDIAASGTVGDAATQLVTLAIAPSAAAAVLGGATQGPGYTLTAAEAGRIRAGTLRIDAPAIAGGTALLVRDLTLNGGGAAAGIGTLELNTPGIARVEGNLLLANARAQDGIAVRATQRIVVVTPTASIRVRDGAGAPGGTLALVSNNIWVASAAILDRLRADPNYAGRDDDLIDNDGVDAPRGYVEANGVTLTPGGTLYVQNTTAARGGFFSTNDFGGITTGPGGLTIVANAANTNVTAFGRRLNADGSFTTGDDFFFQSAYEATAGSNYTPTAAVDTCIIVTGQCPRRVPPDTGPDGPDPFVGPTGGSMAILLPQNDEDDVIDSSFAADPLIEEPVTSGSEAGAWNCDPDHDGDCDDQPR
jgi:filamentous hemagglutinin family protein